MIWTILHWLLVAFAVGYGLFAVLVTVGFVWVWWEQRRARDRYVDLVLMKGFVSERQGEYCIDSVERGDYRSAVYALEKSFLGWEDDDE